MSGETETPLEAARRYVKEQEEKIDQQRLLIRQFAASGRSTAKAKQDLAVMEHSLILLLGRLTRLSASAVSLVDAYLSNKDIFINS